MILVPFSVVRAHGIGALLIPAHRHADHNGMTRLRDRPAQHRRVLIEARGREEDEVRDVCEDRDVEEAEVRHIVHVVE